MGSEAIAQARYVQVSPTKARLVVDQIRGLGVDKALELLAFSKKRVARTVKTTLGSAIANAESNLGMDVDTLYILRAFVDEGAKMKRFRPRARGRACRILKRTSHITIAVGSKE
ncbi:MAG: 50S ribosomal protein L22 [Magnetococcales bacterium]|nr:50S ribosomal protein L22 [Magnetococcales bacterium]